MAKDVCDALDLTNVSKAIEDLDEDERNTLTISEGNRGNPNVNIISESGLYKIVFKSRKPDAKRFTKWVTSEVLPTLRKTGTYSTPQGPVGRLRNMVDAWDAIKKHCNQPELLKTGESPVLECGVSDLTTEKKRFVF